ncbi:hypothetical protein LTR78_003057 [Recurvomyces mirabilis]|uniref:Uncharacterized protein n=1 Tax=Recurvomyces mirabilis TaxID=574656 RepID=A0AAE0WS64_9PEZI|nr:hypothetical protein LTR78_003057 [Recurvomyces mirabilis]KAK5157121.1 hypothetical protein LTS14_004639 [Recurvomyces mirabilis]
MSTEQTSNGPTLWSVLASSGAPTTRPTPTPQQRSVLAVLMVIWTIWSGILSLRYSAIQTCASLIAVEERSAYCDKIVKGGVTPPPKDKRDSGKLFAIPFNAKLFPIPFNATSLTGQASNYAMMVNWDQPDIYTELCHLMGKAWICGIFCYFFVTKAIPWLESKYSRRIAKRARTRRKKD